METTERRPDNNVRLQIRVPSWLASQLADEARELTIPTAALVRQVLLAHVRSRQGRSRDGGV